MRYCPHCKITIESNYPTCPLCQKETIVKEHIEVQDSLFNVNKRQNNSNFVFRLLAFAFIFLIGLNLIINDIFDFKLLWSPYAIVPLFYTYLLIKMGLKSYKDIGRFVVNNIIMITIIAIIVDHLLGFQGWSINYIFPSLILAGIAALFIFICIRRTLFTFYVIYLLIIACLGMTLIVFLLTNIITVKLPSIIAIFVSIMSIIAMLMFGDRRIKNELIKRLHI